MKKPNFFIIGGPKCGTTSMAVWLSQHPEIYFSKQKETRYFSRDLKAPMRTKNYEEQFSGATNENIAIGEGSTDYIYSDVAIDEIMKYQPKAKIILMLRNPTDLVLSWHKQLLKHGWQTIESFEEAWKIGFDLEALQQKSRRNFEPKFLQYQFVGSIGTRLSRLIESIDRERLHVIVLDDLRINPNEEFEKVLSFLGVNTNHSIDLSPVNVGVERRSAFLSGVVRNCSLLKHHIGFRGGTGVLSVLEALNKTNRSSRRKDSVNDQTRKYLTEYFQEEVKLLEKILERDLSDWRISCGVSE